MAYATAGVATALAGASSAEAEIHYSGILNYKFQNDINHGGSVKIKTAPLDGGASLKFFRSTNIDGFFDELGVINGAVSNAVRGNSQAAAKLYSGENISAGPFADLHNGRLVFLTSQSGVGYFHKTGEGFVGFKFNTGSGTQYGWVRIKIGNPAHRFLVEDYAWGDPGDQIAAGQTSAANQQVNALPVRPSLGLLALGGVGLAAARAGVAQTAP